MKLPTAVWLAGLMIGSAAPCAAAPDACFVIIWGAQRPALKLPRAAHSFATFVRVCADGRFEEATISWLPATGVVRPLALRSEPGRNYGLCETMQFCAQHDLEVAYWGPYQVAPELWERALFQKARLESGAVRYKADDDAANDGVSNCVHAIGGVVRQPGEPRQVKMAPANWGESGSFWEALRLRPWYVDPCQTHPWVLCRLGFEPGSFQHNDLARNPTRSLAIRALQAATHRSLLPNRVVCPP